MPLRRAGETEQFEQGVPSGSLSTRSPRHVATWSVAATALTALGALLLGFVADVTVLGRLRHHHDQTLNFAKFRADLANATAPVSGINEAGRLYALGTSVAIIEIPRLGVMEVVGEGTTSGVLVSGPGHRRDTVFPGQVGDSVIMGRHTAFGGPFGHLKDLKAGDVITVTTGQGKQSFAVSAIRGSRTAPEPVPGGQSRLTLVTSSGSGLVPNDTIAVDAALTSAVQSTAAVAIAPGGVSSAELPNRSDRGAWVPLVFWLQGLLLAAIAVTVARVRWGRWQAWIAGTPLLLFLGVETANQAAQLLPNLT